MEVYKFKCGNCGSSNYKKDGNVYECLYCGNREEVFHKDKTTSSMDLKKIALDALNDSSFVILLICVFFGYFGVHKFFEKKYVIGIVYFFTAGLFVVGWIIDICNYAQIFVYKFKEKKDGQK